MVTVLPRLDDDQWRVDMYVGFAERGDDAVAAPVGWSEVDEQDLAFIVTDDFGQLGAQADQVDAPEPAFEDGELQVDAPSLHGLEDFQRRLGPAMS